MTSNSSGTVVDRVSYFPFGTCRNSTAPLDTDKLFTGQRLDQTGLYFYNARYYDSTIGRFISPDSIVPNPANPQSLNRYSYCLNNPLKYTDPSGHGGTPTAEEKAATAAAWWGDEILAIGAAAANKSGDATMLSAIASLASWSTSISAFVRIAAVSTDPRVDDYVEIEGYDLEDLVVVGAEALIAELVRELQKWGQKANEVALEFITLHTMVLYYSTGEVQFLLRMERSTSIGFQYDILAKAGGSTSKMVTEERSQCDGICIRSPVNTYAYMSSFYYPGLDSPQNLSNLQIDITVHYTNTLSGMVFNIPVPMHIDINFKKGKVNLHQ